MALPNADDMRALAPEAAAEAIRRYPKDADKALLFFQVAVGMAAAPITADDITWAKRHIDALHAPQVATEDRAWTRVA